jgi:hypothetical protein
MPIDLLVLAAAALTGLLGGVHCVAMCGGIATTLGGTAAKGFPSALALNLGRVLGYTLAGALVGGLGGGLLQLARIEGLAQSLRTLVGVVMLVAAARLLWPRRFHLLATPGAGLWRWLQPLRERVMAVKGPLRPLLLGALWGWLPCGLSTTVLVAAWLEASALHGGLLMLAFGLGTLPLVTSLSWSGAHYAALLARPAWRGAAAALIAGAGLLTLLAPWLASVPEMHELLEAMGCRSL